MTMTSEEYVSNGGNHCPVCGGEDLDTSRVQTDSGIAWQNCTCGKCGAEWVDQYDLVGYGELSE